MRLGLRTPFFGMPEDASILGDAFEGYHEPPTTIVSPAQYAEIEAEAIRYHQGERHMIGCMGDGMTEGQAREVIPGAVKRPHPDAVEKGTEIALGFMQHQGENRTQRRAAVANW
jgi:hypothetical protein